MIRIIKSRWFSGWARRQQLSDALLRFAVHEMEHGLIDANLGGLVYKKRIAIEAQGKSAGVRTIIAFRANDKAFFIYGFAKNARDNISSKELKALKALARELLSYDDTRLMKAILSGKMVEIK